MAREADEFFDRVNEFFDGIYEVPPRERWQKYIDGGYGSKNGSELEALLKSVGYSDADISAVKAKILGATGWFRDWRRNFIWRQSDRVVARKLGFQPPPSELQLLLWKLRQEFTLSDVVSFAAAILLGGAVGAAFGGMAGWWTFAAVCGVGWWYDGNPVRTRKAVAGWARGNFARVTFPSPGELWAGMRGGWRLVGALTDLLAGAGCLVFGGGLVSENTKDITGTWGLVGLALLAAGLWFARKGAKKLRAWWAQG